MLVFDSSKKKINYLMLQQLVPDVYKIWYDLHSKLSVPRQALTHAK